MLSALMVISKDGKTYLRSQRKLHMIVFILFSFFFISCVLLCFFIFIFGYSAHVFLVCGKYSNLVASMWSFTTTIIYAISYGSHSISNLFVILCSVREKGIIFKSHQAPANETFNNYKLAVFCV